MEITVAMIESLHSTSVDLAKKMLETPHADVRPFLLLVWPAEDGEGVITYVDAAPFHVSRDGSGKEAMMVLIGQLLDADAATLSALGLGSAPSLISHGAEAWQVVGNFSVNGTTPQMPTNSLKDHPERTEILLIDVHQAGRTHFARHDLTVDAAGMKSIADSAIEVNGDVMGRLAIQRSTMH